MGETTTHVNRTGYDPARTNSSAQVPGPSRWYLLFAGSDQTPRGGLGDLVQTFRSHEMAHSAFRQMRLSGTSAACWAQLAVVDAANGIQPLCWFGIGATPNRRSTLVLPSEGVGSHSRARTARQRSSRLRLWRTP